MMSIKQQSCVEALKQAVEFINNKIPAHYGGAYILEALEQAIARAESTSEAAVAEQHKKQEPKCVVIVEVFGKDWRLEYMSLPVGRHKLYTQQYLYTHPPKQSEEL